MALRFSFSSSFTHRLRIARMSRWEHRSDALPRFFVCDPRRTFHHRIEKRRRHFHGKDVHSILERVLNRVVPFECYVASSVSYLEIIERVHTLLEVELFRLLSLLSRVRKDELYVWSSRGILDDRHVQGSFRNDSGSRCRHVCTLLVCDLMLQPASQLLSRNWTQSLTQFFTEGIENSRSTSVPLRILFTLKAGKFLPLRGRG